MTSLEDGPALSSDLASLVSGRPLGMEQGPRFGAEAGGPQLDAPPRVLAPARGKSLRHPGVLAGPSLKPYLKSGLRASAFVEGF